jgi:hypothetical protein
MVLTIDKMKRTGWKNEWSQKSVSGTVWVLVEMGERK